METEFFGKLPAFRDFAQVTQTDLYRPVPNDWYIVVTDIVNSSGLIAKGRYRDVNSAGGSALAALINIAGYSSIPFVFGGDGASAAVPPSIKDKVIDAWTGLAVMIRGIYDIDMRVGLVSVAQVREAGADLSVARYELSPGNSIAMFRGGGLSLADRMIKEDVFRQCPIDETIPVPDLTGLSCRWDPIPALKGHVVSLIVRRNGDNQTDIGPFDEILALIERFTQKTGTNNPVSKNGLTLSDIWSRFGWEGCRHDRGGAAYKRSRRFIVTMILQRVLQKISHRFSLSMGDYHPVDYAEEMIENSDYRKLDDMLRMVVDLDHADWKRLLTRLKHMEAEGLITFGYHLSSHAIMTCFVESLDPPAHVHFIDGDDGGYAMAAHMLKQK